MLPQARAFDTAYEGTPTWEIGRPQPAVLRLLEAGLVAGDVLEVGCGTGAHARLLAERGHHVLGIDFSVRAIELARARSAARATGAGAASDDAGAVSDDAAAVSDDPPAPEFLVADVRDLAGLGRSFDTVLDVGCFHTLQPEDREVYASNVHGVLRPGGRLLLLCWSDRNPFGYGPSRIRRRDIAVTFRSGWALESVTAETLDTRLESALVHAWLAVVTTAGGR